MNRTSSMLAGDPPFPFALGAAVINGNVIAGVEPERLQPLMARARLAIALVPMPEMADFRIKKCDLAPDRLVVRLGPGQIILTLVVVMQWRNISSAKQCWAAQTIALLPPPTMHVSKKPCRSRI